MGLVKIAGTAAAFCLALAVGCGDSSEHPTRAESLTQLIAVSLPALPDGAACESPREDSPANVTPGRRPQIVAQATAECDADGGSEGALESLMFLEFADAAEAGAAVGDFEAMFPLDEFDDGDVEAVEVTVELPEESTCLSVPDSDERYVACGAAVGNFLLVAIGEEKGSPRSPERALFELVSWAQ